MNRGVLTFGAIFFLLALGWGVRSCVSGGETAEDPVSQSGSAVVDIASRPTGEQWGTGATQNGSYLRLRNVEYRLAVKQPCGGLENGVSGAVSIAIDAKRTPIPNGLQFIVHLEDEIAFLRVVAKPQVGTLETLCVGTSCASWDETTKSFVGQHADLFAFQISCQLED